MQKRNPLKRQSALRALNNNNDDDNNTVNRRGRFHASTKKSAAHVKNAVRPAGRSDGIWLRDRLTRMDGRFQDVYRVNRTYQPLRARAHRPCPKPCLFFFTLSCAHIRPYLYIYVYAYKKISSDTAYLEELW